MRIWPKRLPINAAPLLVVVFLAGCSGMLGTTPDGAELTTEQRLYQLEGEYQILAEAALGYAERPRCTASVVIGCSDADVIDRLRTLRRRARASIDEARAEGNPDLPSVQIAMDGLNTLLIEVLQ